MLKREYFPFKIRLEAPLNSKKKYSQNSKKLIWESYYHLHISNPTKIVKDLKYYFNWLVKSCEVSQRPFNRIPTVVKCVGKRFVDGGALWMLFWW